MAVRDKQAFKPGDQVAWDASGGHSTGNVVRKITKPTRIKTHAVAASPKNPEYLVQSDKTGAIAAQKPGALKK